MNMKLSIHDFRAETISRHYRQQKIEDIFVVEKSFDLIWPNVRAC